MHASATYYNTREIELAERLASTLPAPLQKSMFALSGSDSNEAAMAIAKKVTGRWEIASPHASFHGLSESPRQVTYGFGHKGLPPGPPGNFAMLAPYCYRCPVGHSFPECEVVCLDASLELLDVETSDGLAAVITEPLFSGGRGDRAATGLAAARCRSGSLPWRIVHPRRGPDRSREAGHDVGVRAGRRRARHRDRLEALRRRDLDQRRGHEPGHRGGDTAARLHVRPLTLERSTGVRGGSPRRWRSSTTRLSANARS